MSVSIESIVNRWTDPNARPLFKGKLIDASGCCCAQGDVLRCAGWTDKQLREITQENADGWKKVAAAGDAAGAAAGELVGINLLASSFFLKFFFDDVPAWLASVDAQTKETT